MLPMTFCLLDKIFYIFFPSFQFLYIENLLAYPYYYLTVLWKVDIVSIDINSSDLLES